MIAELLTMGKYNICYLVFLDIYIFRQNILTAKASVIGTDNMYVKGDSS